MRRSDQLRWETGRRWDGDKKSHSNLAFYRPVRLSVAKFPAWLTGWKYGNAKNTQRHEILQTTWIFSVSQCVKENWIYTKLKQSNTTKQLSKINKIAIWRSNITPVFHFNRLLHCRSTSMNCMHNVTAIGVSWFSYFFILQQYIFKMINQDTSTYWCKIPNNEILP